MNKIEPTLIEYILELYSKFLLQLLIFRVKCFFFIIFFNFVQSKIDFSPTAATAFFNA